MVSKDATPLALGCEYSASIDMNMNSKNEDSIKSKENKSMNSNGLAIGLHAPDLQRSAISRYLKQKPRLQQYEEYHPNDHWSPVRHSTSSMKRCANYLFPVGWKLEKQFQELVVATVNLTVIA